METAEFRKTWKKAQQLEADYEASGRSLSRLKIAEELGVSENDARFIVRALKNIDILTTKNTASVHAAKTLDQRLRTELRDATVLIKKLTRQVEVHSDLAEQRLDPPRWLTPAISKKSNNIAGIAISDTHFDEYVNPEEINHTNAYSREIALSRLQKCCESVIKLDRDHFSGIKTEAIVVNLVGDMVSGNIHEELEATNQAHIIDTILFWAEQMVAFLQQLLEHFKKMYVVCVVGNHGRLKPKVKFKGAVQDNYDYLLYNLIAKEFRGKKKYIKFHIPLSPDAYYPIYNTRYCLTHGSQFRGGQGWAGPLMPIMRGDRKKKERQATIKKPYDVLVCGHFHTFQKLSTAIMNGSLIGYSEYAAAGNFNFEVPQQAFWLTSPTRGTTISTPIHCKSKNEGWEKNEGDDGVNEIVEFWGPT